MDTTIDLPPDLTAPPLSRPAGDDAPGHAGGPTAGLHPALDDGGEFFDGAAAGGSGAGSEPGTAGPPPPPARPPISSTRRSRRQGILFATTAILVVAVSAGVVLHRPLLATIARLRHEHSVATGSIPLPKPHNSTSVLNHRGAGAKPLDNAIPGLSVPPMPGKTQARSPAEPKTPSTVPPSGQASPSPASPVISPVISPANGVSGVVIRKSATAPDNTPSQIGPSQTGPSQIGPIKSPATPAGNLTPAFAVATSPSQPASNTPTSTPLVGPIPPAGTLQSIPHPVKAAIQIVAAPTSRTDEVKTMSLVAALGRLVAELRSQNAAMQTEISTLRQQVDHQMLAFDQRLTFDQAHDALALAGAADPASVARAPLPVHSAQIFPVSAPHAAPVSPAAYAIQAASPGLAMLVRNGTTYEVSVGSVVPGVGRVISIVEYGSGWIVRTDHGVIR